MEASKFLRIGGRGDDGTAKPFKTNNRGSLESKLYGNNIEALSGVSVPAGGTVESDPLECVHPGIKVDVRWNTGSAGFDQTLYIEYISESGVLLDDEQELEGVRYTIDGNFVWRYRIDKLKSKLFKIKVKNEFGSARTLGSLSISSIDDVIIGSNYKDLLEGSITLSPGSEFTTDPFESTNNTINVLMRSSGSGTVTNSPTVTIEFLSRNRLTVIDSIEHKTEYNPQFGNVIYVATIANLKNKFIRLRVKNNESANRVFSYLMVNGVDNIFPDYEKSEYTKKLPKSTLSPEIVSEADIKVTDVDDEYLYGFDGTIIYRSNDALETSEAGFDLDSEETGWEIQGVFKTHHGFVIVADKDGSGSIWFSENFGSVFTKRKLYEDGGDVFEAPSVFGDLAMHFKNSSKLNDICMVGEYSTHGENVYVSLDGGQTWDLSLNVPRVDTGVNHHVHIVLHDDRNGVLWAIYGDGADNRAWKYSLDKGENWSDFIPLNSSSEFAKSLQPTAMVPTSFGYVVAPDFQQSPGFFGIRRRNISKRNLHDFDGYAADQFRDRPFFDLTKEVFIDSPNETSGQYYPRFPFVYEGNVLYVLFGLQAGSPGKVSILASGDGGNSWHQVFHYHPSTATQSGLVGICKDGYIYFEGRVDGDRKTHRAKVIEWE